MDKKLIFAVAGSGKTYKIVQETAPDKKNLILTYTNENVRSIKSAVEDKYGRMPKNITVMSYFSFLYSFCFRPFHSYELRDNSYTWKMPVRGKVTPYKNKVAHYVTKRRYLYSNRLAKFLIEFGTVAKINQRLEEFYDCLFVDEVQDFSANDFNFLLELSKANLGMMFVGDYFQHTFDTSRDGNTRKNLHKNGVEKYLKNFKDAGFEIDTNSLEKTRRCSPEVCQFITDIVGIPISTNNTESTNVIVVTDPEEACKLFDDESKVKLFYNDSSKFDCYSNNWGLSKGLNCYDDVCVVLNKGTQEKFENQKMSSLADTTQNKLYVACSRPFGDLYIINEHHLKHFKNA